MPWILGGTPVAIEELLTLVKEGIAARARPRWPSTAIRCRFGIRPRAKAASRYSSAEPSRQMTTMGRAGGWYARWLTTNGFVAGLDMAGSSGAGLRPRRRGAQAFGRQQTPPPSAPRRPAP